jgi:hypothetical protein
MKVIVLRMCSNSKEMSVENDFFLDIDFENVDWNK